MRGVFNGYSINGSSLPDWLRYATVVAAAAASVTITPTRTTFAAAYGDASVVVTLTGNQNVAARAAGFTDSSSYARGNVIYSPGAASRTAQAVGYASVLRYVSAEADGDGTSIGLANAADALGESTASASSSSILCEAHRIRAGASLQPATLTATQPNGDVTRYVSVDADAGSPIGRAEASGSSTAEIVQEKAVVSATLGSFQYGDATGQLSGFLRRPGASL